MAVRIGINGFGRIGRQFVRATKEQRGHGHRRRQRRRTAGDDGAPCSSTTPVLGTLPYDVQATDDGIMVDGDELRILAEPDPKALPWDDLGVDVVVESTGRYTHRDNAAAHLAAPSW